MANTPSPATYYFAPAALSIQPDPRDTYHSLIRITCAPGARVAHCDTALPDKVLRQTGQQQAADAARDTLGLTPSLSFRQYAMQGYDTALAEEDERHIIYLRLDPHTGTALVVLARTEHDTVEWNTTRSPLGDEIPDYTSIRYAWVPIGELTAWDDTRATREAVIHNGTLCVLTAASGSAEWYTVLGNTVALAAGYAFSALKALKYAFRKDNNNDTYQDIDSVATSDATDTLASTQPAAADTRLTTLGFLLARFLPFLRSSMVRKDNADGTETMDGSLATRKYLSVGGDVETDGSICAQGSAFIGGNVATDGELSAQGTARLNGGTVTTYARATDFGTGDSATTRDETLTGQGATAYSDADGKGHVVTDYLAVRRAAHFREITTDEVKHIGGELILSQAACQIARVVALTADHTAVSDTAGILAPKPNDDDEDNDVTTYRLFFESSANGHAQHNAWRAGDQARGQSFQPLATGQYQSATTAYYWRLVTNVYTAAGTEDHYIDVSNDTNIVSLPGCADGPGCDTGCSTPRPGDTVALLGARSDEAPSRATAQVYSTAETNSPSRRYYQGITSFSLATRAMERLEWDATAKHLRYELGDSASYIHYGWNTARARNELDIKANSIQLLATNGQQTDVAEAIDGVRNSLNDIQTSGLVTEANFATVFSHSAEAVSFIQTTVADATSYITLHADKILFEGYVSANNTFSIATDGTMVFGPSDNEAITINPNSKELRIASEGFTTALFSGAPCDTPMDTLAQLYQENTLALSLRDTPVHTNGPDTLVFRLGQIPKRAVILPSLQVTGALITLSPDPTGTPGLAMEIVLTEHTDSSFSTPAGEQVAIPCGTTDNQGYFVPSGGLTAFAGDKRFNYPTFDLRITAPSALNLDTLRMNTQTLRYTINRFALRSFADALLMGRDTENAFFAAADGTQGIRLFMRSGDFGMQIARDGQTALTPFHDHTDPTTNTSGFTPVPVTVYYGRIQTTAGNAGPEAAITRYLAAPSLGTRASVDNAARYTITLTGTQGRALSRANTIVSVTGASAVCEQRGSNIVYNENHPVKATLLSFDNNTLVIQLSDDDTPNYGDFYLRLEYFGN